MIEKVKICAAIIVIVAVSLFVFINKKNEKITWPTNDSQKKVVILGFDGVEHTLLDTWVKEGKLPNIASLMTNGSYSLLDTTIPAQSPVAWSTFATGTNPGKHDVMDFIVRDPKTYKPSIGMANIKETLFGKPEITSKQQGQTFWDILSENGLKSKIIKVPITFPAKPINGDILSGLGTPDAMGTMGTFSYYTTTDTGYTDNDQAYNLYNLQNVDSIMTKIQGPKNYSQRMTINRLNDSFNLTIGNKTTNT
jgi:predicted AlkP superfamily phosphohydrolase/phosphomutase